MTDLILEHLHPGTVTIRENELKDTRGQFLRRSLVCAGIGFAATAIEISMIFLLPVRSEAVIGFGSMATCLIAVVSHLIGIVVGAIGLSWTRGGNRRPALAMVLNFMLLVVNIIVSFLVAFAMSLAARD